MESFFAESSVIHVNYVEQQTELKQTSMKSTMASWKVKIEIEFISAKWIQ